MVPEPTFPNWGLRYIAASDMVWLTDMGVRLPAIVQLDGLDISLKATPPAEWLPSNVSFREWDIRSDVPEDLVGQYDIVHVRLLIFVLPSRRAASDSS
ncbi:hypothetical protein F4808DRAFT_466220 [Astrocystis sublimbata]|nr:hypothetical protein F4808DRAFT_466220 [Astrocystis sublimbata]